MAPAASEGPSLIGQTVKYGFFGAAFGSTIGVFEGAWKDPHPTKPLRARPSPMPLVLAAMSLREMGSA